MLLRLLPWGAAAALLIGPVVYAYRHRHSKAHPRARNAAAALAVAVICVIVGMMTWSTSTRLALGEFLTSPGLGGIAAASAAGLALFGVMQQLKGQDKRWESEQKEAVARENAVEARHKAEQWRTNYRWAADHVLSAETVDMKVVEVALDDLLDTAPTVKEVKAARGLMRRYREIINSAPEPGTEGLAQQLAQRLVDRLAARQVRRAATGDALSAADPPPQVDTGSADPSSKT